MHDLYVTEDDSLEVGTIVRRVLFACLFVFFTSFGATKHYQFVKIFLM